MTRYAYSASNNVCTRRFIFIFEQMALHVVRIGAKIRSMPPKSLEVLGLYVLQYGRTSHQCVTFLRGGRLEQYLMEQYFYFIFLQV